MVEGLGVTVRVDSAAARIEVGGVALADGTEFMAPLVRSNLHPRTTFLDLLEGVAVTEITELFGGTCERLREAGVPLERARAIDEKALGPDRPTTRSVRGTLRSVSRPAASGPLPRLRAWLSGGREKGR